jgi:hypothetical protein
MTSASPAVSGHVAVTPGVSPERHRLGSLLIRGATILLGLIIVGKLFMAALSRADNPRAVYPPFYLYIDEFQNFATPSIASILSEARKYNLSLTVAHQFIAPLLRHRLGGLFQRRGHRCLVWYRTTCRPVGCTNSHVSPRRGCCLRTD